LTAGPSIQPYLLLAQLEIQRGNFKTAMDHVDSALNVEHDSPDCWAFLGHLQYVQKLTVDAKWTFETVLSLPKGNDLIFFDGKFCFMCAKMYTFQSRRTHLWFIYD
jgi:Tfp pilus assembly protein PilF